MHAKKSVLGTRNQTRQSGVCITVLLVYVSGCWACERCTVHFPLSAAVRSPDREQKQTKKWPPLLSLSLHSQGQAGKSQNLSLFTPLPCWGGSCCSRPPLPTLAHAKSTAPNPNPIEQPRSQQRASEESDNGRRRNGRAPRRDHRPVPFGGRRRGRRAGRRRRPRRRHYTPQPQVPRHRLPRHLCCLLGCHDRQLQLRIQPGQPTQVRFASSLFIPLRISSRPLF